jgi:hypothetical protein
MRFPLVASGKGAASAGNLWFPEGGRVGCAAEGEAGTGGAGMLPADQPLRPCGRTDIKSCPMRSYRFILGLPIGFLCRSSESMSATSLPCCTASNARIHSRHVPKRQQSFLPNTTKRGGNFSGDVE